MEEQQNLETNPQTESKLGQKINNQIEEKFEGGESVKKSRKTVIIFSVIGLFIFVAIAYAVNRPTASHGKG